MCITNHVRREERLAVLLEVGLIGIEHSIEPWKQLLRAVVGVENDGDSVERSDGADVVGSRDSAIDRCRLILVFDTLACRQKISNCPFSSFWFWLAYVSTCRLHPTP